MSLLIFFNSWLARKGSCAQRTPPRRDDLQGSTPNFVAHSTCCLQPAAPRVGPRQPLLRLFCLQPMVPLPVSSSRQTSIFSSRFVRACVRVVCSTTRPPDRPTLTTTRGQEGRPAGSSQGRHGAHGAHESFERHTRKAEPATADEQRPVNTAAARDEPYVVADEPRIVGRQPSVVVP